MFFSPWKNNDVKKGIILLLVLRYLKNLFVHDNTLKLISLASSTASGGEVAGCSALSPDRGPRLDRRTVLEIRVARHLLDILSRKL